MPILLDTHVVQWMSAEPERLSRRAAQAINASDELTVASVSWYELAWLARRERIIISVPISSWLDGLARLLRTVPLTPAVAATAASLPDSFPRNPTDWIIYATAIEQGCQLITRDERLRGHRYPRQITIW
jgi:PIN domain nuclease of toxin-antitoxin system